MKYILFLFFIFMNSCSSSHKEADLNNEQNQEVMNKPSGYGVTIEASDIYFDPDANVAHFDVFGQCLKSKSAIFLKHLSYKFSVPCKNEGSFRHRFNFTSEDIKKIRKSKKDHHVYVQAFHAKNEGGKAKLHIFLGYQDFQAKLILANTVRFFDDTREKPVSRIEVFGACRSGSTVDLVVDDESKSLEVFRKKEACAESGFNYVDQIVGELRPDTFFQATITSEAGEIAYTKRFSIHGIEATSRAPVNLLPPPEMKLKKK